MKQIADDRSGNNKALPVTAAVVVAAALAVTLFTARPAPEAADTAPPAGGDIVFEAKEIGTQASYFDYDADGITVQVLAVAGFALPGTAKTAEGSVAAVVDGDVQYVTTTLRANGYDDLRAAGIPVVWIIEADAAALNGCNNELALPAFDRQVRLTEGRNTITFTQEEPGEYLYSCWMGMLRNTITVVPQETGTGVLF